MPALSKPKVEKQLRDQLRQAFDESSPLQGVSLALAHWHELGWQTYLFGGVVRDLYLFGRGKNPRDIDLVIGNKSIDQIEANLEGLIQRKTRFGGFQVTTNRWNFDVWPLLDTWGFINNPEMKANAENLPKTTFLNVEAIAVEMLPGGKIGHIYDAGFYQAVQSKTLDINLEENPAPALAAVRALATSYALQFTLTPRLARYIVSVFEEMGSRALVSAQDSHYGVVRFRAPTLKAIVKDIGNQLSWNSHTVSPLRLKPLQQELVFEEKEPLSLAASAGDPE